jgi:hypothetical protein
MADVANQKLAALEDLWRRKRGSKAIPLKIDLGVTELRPWLGNLALIDLNDVGDGTFRLCGTNLNIRFGIDATGCRIVALPDELVDSILSSITRVRAANAPVRSVCTRMARGAQVSFDDLALPLSKDGVSIATLLFASYLRR